MKKVNATQLLISVLVHIAVFEAIAVVASFVLSSQGDYELGNILPVFCILAAIVSIIVWAISLSWGGSGKKAEKTFNAGLKENEFKNYTTFEASDSFLAIDGVNGRVGYVSNSNSKEFQIAPGCELTDIKSDHVHAPMGGTSGVYFTFKYRGKKTKIYTFLTNGNASMKSEAVMEAISKADFYANLLTQAVVNSKSFASQDVK